MLTYLWVGIDNRLLPNYYLIMKRDKATPIFKSQKSNNRVNIILIDDYRDTVSLLQELQKSKTKSIVMQFYIYSKLQFELAQTVIWSICF